MGALGYTLQMPQEDRFLLLEDELRGQLAILLGGRAAEELIFGKVSTGASIDKAYTIALDILKLNRDLSRLKVDDLF